VLANEIALGPRECRSADASGLSLIHFSMAFGVSAISPTQRTTPPFAAATDTAILRRGRSMHDV
jgi:hypothetical protein